MERIILWGTGRLAESIMRNCGVFQHFSVIGFIDNNEDKQGTSFFERPVYAPSVLEETEAERIILLLNDWQPVREQILREYPMWQGKIADYQYIYREGLRRRYRDNEDEEIAGILEYLSDHDLSFLPYAFWNEYKNAKYRVEWDQTCGMFYVEHHGKKMYFARHYDTREKAEDYYRGLMSEQDIRSPHCYLGGELDVPDGAVVVDCGAAEGFFALDLVERASRIYLLEADERWLEALEQTFRDWKDKVIIAQKYITSVSYEKEARIDDLIDEPVDLIKMDIEGNEWDALLGAEKTISRSPAVKCAICTYHRPYDEMLIRSLLEQYGLTCTTSPGYVWFAGNVTVDTWYPFWLSRGVIRAHR